MTKGREALYVYDVSDVGNIKKSARLSTTPVRGHGMSIDVNHLFAVGAFGVLSIDISSPEEPLTIGELLLEGRFGTFASHNQGRLYTAGGVLGIAKERGPAKYSKTFSPSPTPAGDGVHNGFFQVIDTSNPVHPRLISKTRIDKSLLPCQIPLSACSHGVATVDVRDVNNPTVLAFLMNWIRQRNT